MQRKKLVLCSTLAFALLLVLVPMALADTTVVYDATSDPLPPSIPSLGFQATQTSEFGDWVQLAGTNRVLRTVTVTMVTWADYAPYSADPNYSAASWSHPITLNIYDFVSGTPLNTKGTLLGTVTQNVTIPWRPVTDPTCPTANQWRYDATNCYNGFAFNITFDMSSLNLTLPDDIIVGVAYNTQTYGAAPIGVGGPYNSLNVGALGAATVGTDGSTDKLFWNTSTAAWYADGGTGGVGIFREDSNWTPNGTVNIQITADTPCTTDCYVDPTGNDANLGTAASPFLTIQKGIDTVATNGTVHVAAGTYVEQVEIAKDLTLTGAGSTTVIQSPNILPLFFVTGSYNNKPVVYVHDANAVTIQDLVVDGAGKGNANYRFQGIGYHNAGGTVDTVEIKDVRDTPFSGAQHGVALYANNEDATARSLTVTDCNIIDFQKTGMAMSGAGLTVNVNGCSVTGEGPTAVTAQNGIQIAYDATGSVTDSHVADIAYTGSGWVATGMLFYEGASVDVTGGSVNNSQASIIFQETLGTVAGTTMTSAAVADTEGISVRDYGYKAPDAGEMMPVSASPFDGGSTPAGKSPIGAATTVSVDAVTLNGVDQADSYAVAAWSLGDDVTVSVTDSSIKDWDIGLVAYQSGSIVSLSANNDCIFDNGLGFYTNTAVDQNAENNWWGAASGPYNLAQNPSGTGDEVTDFVDFQPWITDGCPGSTTTGNWQNTTTMAYDDLQGSLDDANPGEEIIFVGTGPVAGGATSNTAGVTINLNGGTFGPGSPFLTVNSADMTLIGPGTLDGGGSGDPAILVVTGGDNFILDGVEVTGWADGIEVANSVTSFKLVNNWIHSNTDAGLQVDAGVTIGGVTTIEGNLFKVNGGNGVQNDSGNSLDATLNSWGADQGPTVAGGDDVSTDVVYDPWTFAEVYIDVDGGVLGTAGDQYVRNVDESTTFDIDLNVDGENLQGLSFQFSYDTGYLTQIGSPVFHGPWVGGNCVDDGSLAGLVRYVCFPLTGPIADWDGGQVATFTFKADLTVIAPNDPGPWSTYFDISADPVDTNAGAAGGIKVFVNNAGFNGPSDPNRDITDANDGQIDITGIAQFTGFVDLQGRPNDSLALVEAKQGTDVKANAISASSGKYTTSYVSAFLLAIGASYDVTVDRALYLPATKNWQLTTRPLTTLTTVLLLGGDATDDDVVDVNDATCIGGVYGGGPAVCGTGGSSDVNGDGVTNILDLVLMGGNYTLFASPW